MKLTEKDAARVRRVVRLLSARYAANHAGAFDDVASFYFLCGAAAVLRCCGPEGRRLGSELQDGDTRGMDEAFRRYFADALSSRPVKNKPKQARR